MGEISGSLGQTEIDYLNGAVWRKGQKYGIATPHLRDLAPLSPCQGTGAGSKEVLGARLRNLACKAARCNN